jgi:uncharacterized membrane protein YjjP (DUF1212 family)
MDEERIAASEAEAESMVAGDPAAELVLALGRGLHQAGVPSDSLEETMQLCAGAVHLELQVTALPTSITAAIGPGYAQKVILLRLEPGVIDLERLAALNAVLEGVVAGRLAAPEALAEVERIASHTHRVPPAFTIAGFLLLSLGASIILGGRNQENTASALIGVAAGVLAVTRRHFQLIDRLFEVLAAFVATVIVTAYSRFVAPIDVYIPIVAGVVQLLPGLQLTTALHELAYRNLVAGTARLGSVLMTLLLLGCGFALGIAVVGTGAMHMEPLVFRPIPWYVLAAAVVCVSGGISILQNARLADYRWVLASCAVAEIVYRVLVATPSFQVASFGAALVVGLTAILGSRFLRVPVAVLLVPGVLILVPGSLSYESILFTIQRDSGDAAGIALTTVIASVELVCGLLLAQLLVPPERRRAGGG